MNCLFLNKKKKNSPKSLVNYDKKRHFVDVCTDNVRVHEQAHAISTNTLYFLCFEWCGCVCLAEELLSY